jgi:hypothetical protein
MGPEPAAQRTPKRGIPSPEESVRGPGPERTGAVIGDDVIHIAGNRARIEIERQAEKLRYAMARVKADAVAAGVAGSSIPLLRIAELSATAAAERGDLVWMILHRVIATAGVAYAPDLESELKAIVDEFLSPALVDLKAYARDAARTIGITPIIPRLDAIVEAGQRTGQQRAHNEIELFVAFLRARKAVPEPSALTFNVYAPIGAIQTGDNAAANILQNLEPGFARDMREALEAIGRQLPRAEGLSIEAKAEVMDIVREARIEVGRREPNRLKLVALITAAAAAIRAIPSLKPAYEMLKRLMESAGMRLPW